MREILLVCYKNGIADVSTEDYHISQENLASVVKIDFSKLGETYKDHRKWCDVIASNGSSFRLDLGEEDKVEFELTSSMTIEGELLLRPFITDEDLETKIKFVPNQSVIIKRLSDIGDQEVAVRDDFIFTLHTRLLAIEEYFTPEGLLIDGGEF